MINLQGVEGNLSWFYVLIRKIEGSILANILNLDSLIGSHPFAHLDVKRPKPASSIWTGCRLYVHLPLTQPVRPAGEVPDCSTLRPQSEGV